MGDDEIRRQFDQWGYVRVPGAFDREDSLRMRDWLWERLRAVHGIERDDPGTWDVPWPGTHVTEKTFGRSPERMATDAFRRVADAGLGAGAWRLPKDWSGALISFPRGDNAPWTVVSDGWHWDAEIGTHRDGPRSLFTFAVFSEIEPQGGGTLLLAGSHHLLNRFYDAMTPEERASRMKGQRSRFHRSHPYLAELTGVVPGAEDRVARYRGRVDEVDGVPVQVVEVTGEPGDAYVCHPALLHAVSMNCRAVPRLMRITTATMRDVPAAAG